MSAEKEHWKRTFSLDLLRAVPMGITETVSSTFAMFVAVGLLDVGTLSKSAIIAGPALGMLLSMFSVAMVRRMGLSANVAAAIGWIGAALGYACIALFPQQELLFVVSIVFATLSHTVVLPLQAQIYRQHYPDRVRGRLFSMVGMLRSAAAAGFGFFAGAWLLNQGEGFSPLFWVFSVANVVQALFTLGMGKVYLRKSQKLSLLSSFSHLKEDKVFRKLISSWMILGFGNLLCMALFVEYITNPDYGFGYGAEKVSLITTTVPMLIFIVSIVGWGMVYDKMEFYRLRVIVNVFFFAGLLVYFLVPSFWGLCIGMALHGVGKSGGNVLWSLWTTRFAPADKVSEYMSVHTFFTGVRGMIAAFLAFSLAKTLGPGNVALIGASCILIASLMLLPELKANWHKRV
ncbi:MFS transporter [Rubritalea spongiae]|uniref:MFS transporter n=1 Tax=Rubritalea spongiae TaxID=430797 RepID=A0ABW5E3M8_9BACT